MQYQDQLPRGNLGYQEPVTASMNQRLFDDKTCFIDENMLFDVMDVTDGTESKKTNNK